MILIPMRNFELRATSYSGKVGGSEFLGLFTTTANDLSMLGARVRVILCRGTDVEVQITVIKDTSSLTGIV